jgi:hypothetical protein
VPRFQDFLLDSDFVQAVKTEAYSATQTTGQ